MAKRYVLQAVDDGTGLPVVWVSGIRSGEEMPGIGSATELTTLAEYDTGTRDRDSIDDPFRELVTGFQASGNVPWKALGSGTPTITSQPSEVNHDGIIRIGTSANTNDYNALVPGLATNASTPIITADAIEEFEWIIRIPTVTNVSVNVGLMQDIAAANGGTDAIMFTADTVVGTTWRCNSRQAGTPVTADTGITFTAGNWVQLGAKRNGAKWDYYANDGYLFSLTGTPAVSHTYGARVLTRSAAVRTLDLDHFSMSAKIQRYT